MDASSPWWEKVVYAAVAGAVFALLTWWGNRRERKGVHAAAKRGAAAGATEAVKPMAETVAKTYESVNGDGLTGMVKRIDGKVDEMRAEVTEVRAEQVRHAADDRQEFGAMRRYIGMPDGDARPRAGG